MYRPENAALSAHALFFNPAYMTMRLSGTGGPKHYPTEPGAWADKDGNAYFTYIAPHAKTVEVGDLGGGLGGKRFPMEKGEDGVWRVKVEGLAPGFHYHHYFVDGNCVPNAQAPFGYGSHEAANYVEIPDPDDDRWLCRDVPHGMIHMALYKSSKTGVMQNVWVYTPPSYLTEPEKRYPVLYLHHGGGENETGWIWQGKINYIADNLIFEGKCRELIIVMPCMYDIDYEHPDEFIAGDYDRLLTHDLMPLIERDFRTLPGGENRAVCGLSMGSYHSACVSCAHPGMFGYTGMLSGSFDKRWYGWVDCREVIKNDPVFREKTKCFFQAIGTDETRLYPQVQENRAYLDACGVAAAYFECPGYHEWTVWRKSICEFLALLFQ